MPVEYKDYYAVLELARDATGDDIKKAFRRLARLYHPDVAKDKTAAESRFKDINEANEVLSDPDKRRRYDELGADWNNPARQAAAAPGGFGGQAGTGTEFHFEGTGFSDFFEQFFGGREHPFAGFDQSRTAGAENTPFPRRGRDVESGLLVTLAEIVSGSTRTIRLQRTDPRTRQATTQTLRVRIPPGVRDGQLVRLAGKGETGHGGGPSGDLYLSVRFAQHPDFQVRGADLYHHVEVSPWDAVLGSAVLIPTLDGQVSLKIPAGTAARKHFRLRGKGLPTGNGTRGDYYAVVSIQVPSQLTPDEKALWEQLAAQARQKPRQSP
ncbi:MAG: DnaJ domain-containing protein [Lentisphaerae bacterium]|nr:DnaJ domain-containing protein [Lentisphaerota bacterium]